MSVQEEGVKVLAKINAKLEEGRMLWKVYPKLQRNMWFYDQIDKLIELAIETEKILAQTKEVK